MIHCEYCGVALPWVEEDDEIDEVFCSEKCCDEYYNEEDEDE